jgi:hypothetical protein
MITSCGITCHGPDEVKEDCEVVIRALHVGSLDRSLGCDLVCFDMPLPIPRHGELPPAPPGQPVRWRGVMILGAWW